MSVWERFEGIASADEVTSAKLQATPIEAGSYAMELLKIEASENKDGLPMIKGQFKIIDTGRIVYYNQMLQNLNYPNMTPINIAEAIKFLEALTESEIDFESLGKLGALIESLVAGGKYIIDVSYATKDVDLKFPKLAITEALENPNDNLPF